MLKLFYIFVVFVVLNQHVLAQSGKYNANQHKSLSYTKLRTKTINSYKLVIKNNTITLNVPNRFSDLTRIIKNKLYEYHSEFELLFGEIPKDDVVVQIMDENYFFKKTGAPKWTNALYYKNAVMIPIGDELNLESTLKALKHEYLHSIIDSLTNGRCPGWLDEGLAQWVEGEENPALAEALDDWLSNNEPISLALLQGGFTKLRNEMVPAAYAQSLFSVNAMIQAFGLESLQGYFKKLKNGESQNIAFQDSFDVSILDYQRYLNKLLNKWHMH